jgi:Na+-translocating ferredoxin:NAD+ oxidoreductase RnfA subunit
VPVYGRFQKTGFGIKYGSGNHFCVITGSNDQLDAGTFYSGTTQHSILRILAFILVIAAVVQFTEMVVHKTSPVLYQILGIFLPLITTNCAVLGVALLNVQEHYSFMQSMVFGFG